MRESIISNERRCYICHTTENLDKHHCMFGTANRKLADEDGLWVYLCHHHHMMLHHTTAGETYAKALRQQAEWTWMQTYHKSIEDWIRRYGKNYLDN